MTLITTSTNTRLDICKKCPELVPKFNYCNICKCYMPLKVKIKKAKCPIGLWGGDHAKR